jgi:CheY-like chemotaxis protein
MPGKKLLVADDSLTIQKVIRLALSNEGYEIQAVADGNDAINQILLFRPDVVLIDVSLPSKNAFDVKREVNDHEDLSETRFVLISSAFEKVDEVQVEDVKFHGRLTKPFDPAHLRKVLSTVLAQVTAKRMEPTSFLARPPLPIEPSETFDFESNSDAPPPLPLEPPHLPSHDYQSDEDEDHPNLPIPPQRRGIALETPQELPDFPHGLPDFPPTPPEEENILPPPMIPGEVSLSESDLLSPPPMPEYEMAPPAPPMTDPMDETDIQHLTESTMRISRMDDYQWSMNEPSMRPSPLMRDRGNSNFSLNSDNENLPHSSDLLPPPPPLLDDNSLVDLPPLNPPPLESEIEEQIPLSYYSDPDSRSPILASEEKIDAMIHNQIEATLEKMIEKLLPQIAEKLIKDEIHRLLSE